MEERAVVAFEPVEHELPVGADGEGIAAHEGEPVEPRHAGADVVGQLRGGGRERHGVGGEIDEHHARERLDADFAQAEVGTLEAGDVLGVAGGFEIAVEIVAPAVEGAGDRADVAAALEQDMPAMHAHIVEGP